jgi:6,7-dimethyl-8-ribityllumazine synthase
LIKWFQVTSVAKSAEDFQQLVRLLELLGLRKGADGENEGRLSAEFFPLEGKVDLQYHKKGWRSVDLALRVSDPDTAFELVKGLGFKVVDDDSGPKPADDFRTFDVQLPGGTRVNVFGLRVLENVIDPDHLALEGNLSAEGKNFAVVVSRFNSFITERLLAGAIDGLVRCGVKRYRGYEIVRVPGAFEIPLAARKLAETKKYDAIICLGCLLRGDTAHYDVIVNEVTRGIGQSAHETGVPHAFGVLTCDTLEQAIDRAGLKMGNKGFEAALAAVEMANLKTAISSRPSAISKATVSRRSSDASKKQIPRGARNDKAERTGNDKADGTQNDKPLKRRNAAKTKRRP